MALARTHRRRVHDVVEDEMPLVQSIVRARQRNGAAPVLPEQLCHGVGTSRRPTGRRVLSVHRCILSHVAGAVPGRDGWLDTPGGVATACCST
jgi:hypothetical protein